MFHLLHLILLIREVPGFFQQPPIDDSRGQRGNGVADYDSDSQQGCPQYVCCQNSNAKEKKIECHVLGVVVAFLECGNAGFAVLDDVIGIELETDGDEDSRDNKQKEADEYSEAEEEAAHKIAHKHAKAAQQVGYLCVVVIQQKQHDFGKSQSEVELYECEHQRDELRLHGGFFGCGQHKVYPWNHGQYVVGDHDADNKRNILLKLVPAVLIKSLNIYGAILHAGE